MRSLLLGLVLLSFVLPSSTAASTCTVGSAECLILFMQQATVATEGVVIAGVAVPPPITEPAATAQDAALSTQMTAFGQLLQLGATADCVISEVLGNGTNAHPIYHCQGLPVCAYFQPDSTDDGPIPAWEAVPTPRRDGTRGALVYWRAGGPGPQGRFDWPGTYRVEYGSMIDQWCNPIVKP